MATYVVQLKKSAEEELAALPAQVQTRIIAALQDLANDPRPDGCKKLKGSEHTYRIRVGDYRVIYEIYDGRLIVFVLRIADRKDAH